MGAGSWTLSKTFTAIGGLGYVNGGIAMVTDYHSTIDGNVWVVGTTHNKSDGTEDGWWMVKPNGTWTRINATALLTACVAQYQARLVGSQLNTLWWTDPGSTTTPPAANFITIQSGHNDVRDLITTIIPYSPTSLLVGTVGSGWWNIEGDITDPVVREMGKDHNASFLQKNVTTQDGAVFLEYDYGTYMTQNMAAQFEELDPHITPPLNDGGHGYGFGYLDKYIFAPAGKVLDTETKAWFTLSATVDNINAFEQNIATVNGISLGKKMYAPRYAANWTLAFYGLEERNSTRVQTYTVKTAPIRNDKGRWMHIREVQVDLSCFGSASTVAVTVNGTTRTSATLAAGTNELSFLFDERAKYLDVQVVPNSNTTSIEAPIIEAIRIGTRPDAHQVA